MISRTSRSSWIRALLTAGGLLAVFAVVSYSAALTKSPTADEPLHLTASYTCRFLGDFRCNPDKPVLWKYWAAIFLDRDDLHLDKTNGLTRDANGQIIPTPWPAMLSFGRAQYDYADQTLYGPGHGDTERAVAAGRLAMLLVAVVLGVLVAGWAGWLGGRHSGPAAMVIASALFVLDPNLLGHASLITNDIAFSLSFVLVGWTTWLVGRKLSLPRAAALALACAVAINIKHSAVLCGPIVAVLLTIRALMPGSWPLPGRRELRRRAGRLAAATLLGLACLIFCIPFTWAVYGFRFGPTNDLAERFNTDILLRSLRQREYGIAMDRPWGSPRELPVRMRAIAWIEAHRLLPQAFTTGFLRFEREGTKRPGYLCGRISPDGWWYYYPAAMAFKTPLGTLGLAALAVAGAAMYIKAKRRRPADNVTKKDGTEESPATSSPSHQVTKSPCHLAILPSCHPLWTLLCLLFPPAVYLAVAMNSAINIGVRHLFPVYPFLLIGGALSLAWLWDRRGKWARGLVIALLLATATETAWSYPNYIAFFNQARGGWRRGARHLADSNIDWGQDLKLLAKWQSRHPDVPLYLHYFGHADPKYYGIRPAPMPPRRPGVLVISSNFATGAFPTPAERDVYRHLVDLDHPDEILGGSLYIYRYPRRP